MRDYIKASEQWERYIYARDNGHIEYIHKSRKCEDFFAGYPNLHWDPAVIARLRIERRPSITINKILSTLSSIVGEQIDLRTETSFRARYGAPSGNADVLTKLFKCISDDNKLGWLRSQMFADGAISSRGYLDIRMDFAKSVTGDVKAILMNPRNVLPDPDASEYDPQTWSDVMVTRWHTVDEIEEMYGKDEADVLKHTEGSAFGHGYDSIDALVDRFGGRNTFTDFGAIDRSSTRVIRVIERQHKKLSKIKYFIDLRTGERKRIPESFNRDKIVASLDSARQAGARIDVDEVMGHRIRWTETADDIVLHDEWSPYQRFTVIPYFPYFRQGRTIGLVENLIDVQELLNKTVSQELHIVNTTANSGWKLKKGSLKNMTSDELAEQGAQSGIVLELDNPDDAEKIEPNQVPSGLDRLSVKAEGYIKTVSARGDAQMGMARADTSAKQMEANNAFSDVGLKWPLDNLARTDIMIANHILELVQEFYTDARALKTTLNNLTGEQTEIKINWPDPETGELLNDLTLGEYEVVVVSTPMRQTLEETQFDQLAYMKEKLGIPIPDEFLIENSAAQNKTGIMTALKEQAESPMAKMQQDNELLAAKLQLAQVRGEIAKDEAQAAHSRSKAAKEMKDVMGDDGEAEKIQAEMALDKQKHDQEMQQKREEHEQEMQMKREEHALEQETKRKAAEDDSRMKRVQAVMAMRQNPQGKPEKQAA